MLGIEEREGERDDDAAFKETISYAFNQEDISSFGFTYIHKSPQCAEIHTHTHIPSEKE